MKSAVVSLVFAASLAVAQSGRLPLCASTCLTGFTSGTVIAGCSTGDVKCICSNGSFLNGIACCLQSVCDDAGKASAITFAKAICGSAGVTVPSSIVCNSS